MKENFIAHCRSRSYGEHFLRAGIAFAFLYPPISALQEPNIWIDYIPLWATTILPLSDVILLNIFGAIEVMLGIWILIARRIYIPASIASIILFYISFAYTGQFPVLFRDVALGLATLGLAFQNYADTNETKED